MTRDGHQFSGIYPMLYALFGADGGLDRAAMRAQVEACIGAGVQGIAVLGLATEVSKLTEAERHQVLDWAAADIAGRLPLAVTVYGSTVAQQAAFVRAAADAGAAWVILQPPPVKGLPEDEYIRFFGAVADGAPLPVAIQNAPEYIGIGLSPAGVRTLHRNHPNVSLIKAEGPALTIRQVVEATDGAITVFNGRNGLELPDNLRAGCAGMIPSPDACDVQARIFAAMQAGTAEGEAEAERLYREILPLLTFAMQSLEGLLTYGKRITAARLGLGAVHDRPPALPPSEFGLACVARYAAPLGPLGQAST